MPVFAACYPIPSPSLSIYPLSSFILLPVFPPSHPLSFSILNCASSSFLSLFLHHSSFHCSSSLGIGWVSPIGHLQSCVTYQILVRNEANSIVLNLVFRQTWFSLCSVCVCGLGIPLLASGCHGTSVDARHLGASPSER